MEMKTCTKCEQTFPEQDFPNQKKGKNGKRSICKACHSESQDPNRVRGKYDAVATDRRKAFKNYGITLLERDKLYAKANYKCELCGSPNHLGIDHCHKTGVIRGILCKRCNISIGGLGDSIEGIQRTLAYLQRAPTEIALLQLLNKMDGKSGI